MMCWNRCSNIASFSKLFSLLKIIKKWRDCFQGFKNTIKIVSEKHYKRLPRKSIFCNSYHAKRWFGSPEGWNPEAAPGLPKSFPKILPSAIIVSQNDMLRWMLGCSRHVQMIFRNAEIEDSKKWKQCTKPDKQPNENKTYRCPKWRATKKRKVSK